MSEKNKKQLFHKYCIIQIVNLFSLFLKHEICVLCSQTHCFRNVKPAVNNVHECTQDLHYIRLSRLRYLAGHFC